MATTASITGASSGIGRPLARVLAFGARLAPRRLTAALAGHLDRR